jgi:hypothetical protein
MALNYTSLFGMIRLYARADQEIAGNETAAKALKVAQIDAVDTLASADYSDHLNDLLTTDKAYISGLGSYRSQFKRKLDSFLVGKGRDLAQSANTAAASIVSDISTFMTRDAQSVLQNTVGNTIAYSRSGDGTVATLTQNQFTRADVITLSCTTAQTAVVDAVFSVRTDYWGALTATVTANNSTVYTDATLGEHLGLTALKIGKGSTGASVEYWWHVGDQITITTTSSDAGILLSAIRDMYDVMLPTASSPTIAD